MRYRLAGGRQFALAVAAIAAAASGAFRAHSIKGKFQQVSIVDCGCSRCGGGGRRANLRETSAEMCRLRCYVALVEQANLRATVAHSAFRRAEVGEASAPPDSSYCGSERLCGGEAPTHISRSPRATTQRAPKTQVSHLELALVCACVLASRLHTHLTQRQHFGRAAAAESAWRPRKQEAGV